MGITSLLRPYFERRYRRLRQSELNAADEQRNLLMWMVRKAKNTRWGRSHNYAGIKDYADYAREVPVSTYEDLKEQIDLMRHGEKDVLWPGRVKWYAKSSGTTNDKSKFIPVSRRNLKDTHYRGSECVVTYYLHNNPHSRMLDGKALILGGSHEPNYNLKHSLVGDLSAILIENITPLANILRVPGKQTALLKDFEVKRDRIARETMGQDVTNISGVPSWMLSVLTRLQEVSGEQDISKIWPHLEVFFHGGVAFTPYRERYRQIISSAGMHYMETYNASEGFFGVQNDPQDTSMLLLTNLGVFYEFIPLGTPQNSREVANPGGPVEQASDEDPSGAHGQRAASEWGGAQAVPLWQVETGRNYAMVITTTSGLWRYQIGDTVKFTSLRPYKFYISGRTKSFINAFGEELIVDNAEKGLQQACEQTGAEVEEYTAAPVFMDANGKCRHQWIIDFRKEPEDINAFAKILDNALQKLNSDYEAKRFKDITLQPLEIIRAPHGLFERWLKLHGKLGGQHKVPRLNNDRRIADELLQLIQAPEE